MEISEKCHKWRLISELEHRPPEVLIKIFDLDRESAGKQTL